jgi:hypothetical protein
MTEVERRGPQAADLSADEWEERKDEAQGIHERILQGLSGERVSAWFLAKQYHDFARCHGWYALGYDSLNEYLASPEITEKRSKFMQYVSVWREFVERQAIDPEDLQEVPLTKLDLASAGLKNGKSVREIVGDAVALSAADLRIKYRGVTPSEDKPARSERSDEVDPTAAAHTTVIKPVDGTEGQTDDLSQPITAAVGEPLEETEPLDEPRGVPSNDNLVEGFVTVEAESIAGLVGAATPEEMIRASESIMSAGERYDDLSEAAMKVVAVHSELSLKRIPTVLNNAIADLDAALRSHE